MTVDLTPTQVIAGLGVLLALWVLRRGSARKARTAKEAAQSGARLLSLTGRVLGMAGVIVGTQWIVITYRGSTTLLLVVLGLPALFAAYTLTRALTVTSQDSPRRRGGQR